MTADKNLLTKEQVAELIGITPDQVLKLRRLHPSPLPGINVSAGARPSWRWRPSTVQTFLRNRSAS